MNRKIAIWYALHMILLNASHCWMLVPKNVCISPLSGSVHTSQGVISLGGGNNHLWSLTYISHPVNKYMQTTNNSWKPVGFLLEEMWGALCTFHNHSPEKEMSSIYNLHFNYPRFVLQHQGSTIYLFFSLDLWPTSFSASIHDVDEKLFSSSFEFLLDPEPVQSWWVNVTGLTKFSTMSFLLFNEEYDIRSLGSTTLLSPTVAPPRRGEDQGLGGGGWVLGAEVDIGVGPRPVQPAGRRLTGAASFSFWKNIFGKILRSVEYHFIIGDLDDHDPQI